MLKSFLRLTGSLKPAITLKNLNQNFTNTSNLARLLFSASTLGYFAYSFSNFSKVQSFKYEEGLNEVETLNASDVKEGDMKPFRVGSGENDIILITKLEGKYYAFAAKCPHAGAPLQEGVLFEEKIICPWHNAGFSVITGKPDHGPSFDALPTYEVIERDGKLIAMLPSKLPSSKEIEMIPPPPIDHRKFVIIGGGPAGLSAAETLRQCGFAGDIIMVIDEPILPYDRSQLSKSLDNSENDLLLRKEEQYQRLKIKVVKDKIKSIATDGIHFEGLNYPQKYNSILLATGASAKIPNIPGVKLENVFTLRNFNDMKKIREKAEKLHRIILVGGSFISMELAGTLKDKFGSNVEVTIVSRKQNPFESLLGAEVGAGMKEILEKAGVQFKCGQEVTKVSGSQHADGVVLQDGSWLRADMVIFGTGTTPNTELVSKMVQTASDGSVITDVYMKSSDPAIFAAGDVATVPYWYSGQRIRSDHFSEAMYQGQIAAFNLLGKKVTYEGVPHYWSRIGHHYLDVVGSDKGYNNIHVDGDIKNQKFIAYYAKDDMIIGASTMGIDLASMIIGQAFRTSAMPTLSELKTKNITLDDIKNRIKAKKGKSKCRRDHCQCKKEPQIR